MLRFAHLAIREVFPTHESPTKTTLKAASMLLGWSVPVPNKGGWVSQTGLPSETLSKDHTAPTVQAKYQLTFDHLQNLKSLIMTIFAMTLTT